MFFVYEREHFFLIILRRHEYLDLEKSNERQKKSLIITSKTRL
jgi:hypothetical protein